LFFRYRDKKQNIFIFINIVFNGYTLFSIKVPCYIDDILSMSAIIIGGAYVYTHSTDTGVSLCGRLEDISVSISNGTETIIELDRIKVKVNGEFNKLIDVLPLYLGEVQPGNKVELPIKVDSSNKNLSLYTLWVLDK